MPRPRGCRRVSRLPGSVLFKPAGVPGSQLDEVVLGVDEMEALHLADLEGLYHEHAAERMNVSRQTFGRIVSEARKKVALALVQGLSLRIEGGSFEVVEQRTFVCHECGHRWQVPFGTGRPEGCPLCASSSMRRAGKQGDGRSGSGVKPSGKRRDEGGRGRGRSRGRVPGRRA